MNPPTDPQGGHRGFDAAVKRREDDHLNRWPLAREIYGIAVTGPSDWSVRVGIYGEWGTGKTSVLEFIAGMAEKDDHVVIWFDPWEHSTKEELWRSFILTVFQEMEAKLGPIAAAGDARRKAWLDKVKGVAQTVIGACNETAGKLVGGGLELVKKHFAFSQEDLASLRGILANKRIVVLIDDLDRTAPELVPEILFALKELMDVPGFSFICAFDPVVVGKVLRQYHRGFGDGLKFLEKIIDYPRWLPPTTAENLTKLAIAESKRFCPFVPADSIRDAVDLLPPNPRAIRQFIRLVALLEPQICRHYDHEIYWPIIIAANILKIRHPRIAHELLNNKEFWGTIDHTSLMATDRSDRNKIANAIDEHINAVTSLMEVALDTAQLKEVKSSMTAICSKINPWTLRNVDFLSYQMKIAEAPHAVTLKEYDQFVTEWTVNQSVETARTWIAEHAKREECTEARVFREVFSGTVHAYSKALSKADNAFAEADKEPLVAKAETLISLLEILACDLGHLDQEEKRLTADELTLLLEKFASMAGAISPAHSKMWPRNEKYLQRIFEKWTGDVTPLLDVLHPYSFTGFGRTYQGPASLPLHKKLCEIVLPRFAMQVLSGFRQQGFVDRFFGREKETYNTRELILDPSGPFWTGLRLQTIATLEEASSNPIIQANAYDLIRWFDFESERGSASVVINVINKLLIDGELFNALWGAVTAFPISTYAAERLNPFIEKIRKLSIVFELPEWWPKPVVKEVTSSESMDGKKETGGDLSSDSVISDPQS